MPHDQDTRTRLQHFVADARKLLTDEFTRQLQHHYGMDPEAGTVAEQSGQLTGEQPHAPMNEQALALEQWLRQVPDDPAGLLRRKFMLEHLMRQKGQQTP